MQRRAGDGDNQILRPGDFSLVGFDDLLDPLTGALAQVSVRGGEPTVAVVDDAIFVPTTEVAPRQFDGALLTSDGEPIPQAMADRRKSRWGNRVFGSLSQPRTLEPAATVDAEVVYLGWFFDHFGHFLLESLARAWALDQIDPAIPVIFHAQRKPNLSGPILEILALLGIPPERIIVPQEQTRFRRVIVPEPLYEISHAANPWFTQPFQRIAATLPPRVTPTDQPLYLSRRLLSSRQRTIVGEFEMEEVLRDNGFLVAHPETMSFVDQVRMVNRHREIFTSAGSGAYMPLFARTPPRLHVLTAGIPFLDFFLAPRAAGMPASFGNVFTGGDRFVAHYAPLLVQFDRLNAYLDAVGQNRRPLRGALSARVTDLEQEYVASRWYRFLSTDGRGNPLPAGAVAEIAELAEASWPLCWALARHSLGQAPELVEALTQHFIALVALETDPGRLIHHYEDISRGLGPISRQVTPETADRLRAVVRDRFLLDADEADARQAARRQTMQAARAPRTSAGES